MTNAEAINKLNSLKDYYNDKNEDSYVGFDNDDNEAIDLAIKALEQTRPKNILDKIRAEIENHCGLTKENHCRYCSYCNNLMGVREILEIIV